MEKPAAFLLSGLILVLTPLAKANFPSLTCSTEPISVLNTVTFTRDFYAPNNERVLIFQDFQENERNILVDGVEKLHVRVSFPDEGNGNLPVVGWIPKDAVTSEQTCTLEQPEGVADDPDEESGVEEGVQTRPSALNPQIPGPGLSDPSLFIFPLRTRALSFMDERYCLNGRGQQTPACQFGSARPIRERRKNRSGKWVRVTVGYRKHAGIDLHGTKGQDVLAVTEGIMIRGPYSFKPPTVAIDVEHQGGFVVRYAEFERLARGVVVGKNVGRGDLLGYMGKVRGAKPMIHFEIFNGTETGPLTVNPRPDFNRRGDLEDPTEYAKEWLRRTWPDRPLPGEQ